MYATRRTQPHRRKTGRQQGPSLSAMVRGRGAYGNPQDVKRATQRRARRRSTGRRRVSLY